MRPPFSFWLRQKENAPRPVEEKKAPSALRCSGPPRARGSTYRCLFRFCLAFGHAIPFYDSPTAVPWRMVRKSSGCKNAFDQLLFPRVPLRYALPGSSWKRERQRKEELGVSQPSPGWRSPQGRCVSVPDFRKGVPAIPRRRQEVRAGAGRPAETFFLLTGRDRFLFDVLNRGPRRAPRGGERRRSGESETWPCGPG